MERYIIFINGRHIKIAILSIDRFNIIPTKKPVSIFAEIDKLILKFIWELMGPRISKLILKKKSGGLTLRNFKAYHKAILVKTVWCWHKETHLDQGNTTMSPETNPRIYGQLILNKGTMVVQWLRLCAPNAGGLGSIPGYGTRSHMLQLRHSTAR